LTFKLRSAIVLANPASRRFEGMSGPSVWDEASKVVALLGREDHLAARITAEREARGWSQSQLAREMANIGYPIPQTAISKIEHPQRGARRAITVDEAIAFARLFDLTLVDLVLPRDVPKNLAVARDLATGPDALVARDEAELAYEEIAQRLADLWRRDAQWRATLDQELHRAVEVEADSEPETPQALARLQFLVDVCVTRQKGKGKR
jgi:transcriptional regulator with XRE-family HTH domain